MKHRLEVMGLFVIFVSVLLCSSATAAADWSIPVTGPDGEITIDHAAIAGLLSDKGVTVSINGESKSGIPLWRVLRLADSNKALGPADIIEISGDSGIIIPFQTILKNDAYVLVETDTGPSLFVSPDAKGSSVQKVKSIGFRTTDDWVLTLISPGEKKEITRTIWNNLAGENRKERKLSSGDLYSGIPIFKLMESQGISPASESNLKVTGGDRYSVVIPWSDISGNADYLLADKMNGEIIPEFIDIGAESGATPAWPLMVIDPEFPGNNSVGNIAELEILQ